MTPKKLEEWEDEWQAAEAALKAAQKMPGGEERFDALRRAGQLRYDADQRRRATEQERGPKTVGQSSGQFKSGREGADLNPRKSRRWDGTATALFHTR